MSRVLPTDLAAALSAKTVALVFLVDIDWPSGHVYMWNGYAPVEWNGMTFVGVGHLGGISEIRETRDMGANGMTLTLSGIPSGNVTEAMAMDAQGRSVKVWMGVVNESGFTIDPYLVMDGLIDAAPINDDGTTSTIALQVEKEMIDNRSGSRRYTDEDQQIDFPGDLGMQYVAVLSTFNITWGKYSYQNYTPAGVVVRPPSWRIV